METEWQAWQDRAKSLTGSELRERRHALGMSQSELGHLLRVAPNTLARWEREEMPIGHPPLISLALDGIEARIRGIL